MNIVNEIKGELPLVSVIVPAYNAEAFITRTLQSIISQTYKNIEILVVDDGSQDKTAEIVELFAQKDNRISLFKQSNSGVASARNLAIENSKGEYIAPIDADDIWYPQKLEKQVQCLLKADQSVGLIYAWSVFIDEEDAIVGQYIPHHHLNVLSIEGEVYPAMLYTNFIINASVPLIRRVCFDKVGGYSSKLREQNAQGCEDWDIYLRIAEYYQFRVVPEFLIGYRQVKASMSNGCQTMEKSYNLVMADFQRKHPEIPAHIYNWAASSFYVHLAWKSRASGDYWSTLTWLNKSIKLDYSPLLLRPVYLCLIECLFKITVEPITSLIWQDHHSWLRFREKFDSQKNRVALSQVTTVSDIQNQMYQPYKLPFKPHARIMWQRWLEVLQLCRALSH